MLAWEHRRLSEPGRFVPPTPKQVKNYRDKWHPDLPLLTAKELLIAGRERQAGLTYHNINYGLEPIRSFITARALEQDLSEVKRSLQQRFIKHGGTEDGLAILGIAAVLASKAASVQGESLDVVYGRLRAQGRLHPMMPDRAGSLILHKLGNYAGRVALLPVLRENLRTSALQSLGALARVA
jgi:hypothetical protein